MSATTSRRNHWALGGVLFAAFFIAGDFLRGALAAGPLPMPGRSGLRHRRWG
jgi:hypothetical protein